MGIEPSTFRRWFFFLCDLSHLYLLKNNRFWQISIAKTLIFLLTFAYFYAIFVGGEGSTPPNIENFWRTIFMFFELFSGLMFGYVLVILWIISRRLFDIYLLLKSYKEDSSDER